MGLVFLFADAIAPVAAASFFEKKDIAENGKQLLKKRFKSTHNCFFIKMDLVLVRMDIPCTFAYNSKIPENMFEFPQYLGFLTFLLIFTIGFWLLLFLSSFVFYWITGASWELYKERKAKKRHKDETSTL